MSQLGFLLEEPPARISASPDCGPVWKGIEEISHSNLGALLRESVPTGFFGKMCPVSFPITRDATLEQFWDSSAAEALKRRATAGETPASFQDTETPTASPIVCWTLNMCEWTGLDGLSLKDDGVCSLSDILETGAVPPQYYLSPQACSGILRRADKRDKNLPAMLVEALEAVAHRKSPTL